VAQPAKTTAVVATNSLKKVLIVASFGGAAAIGCNAPMGVESARLVGRIFGN
jgi:hypothetical protein